MTKQELAIKTLNLAEQLRMNCDNWEDWNLCKSDIADMIKKQYGITDNNIQVEYTREGLEFRICEEYQILAQFTLPAFLEKCYPGGIKSAIELIIKLVDDNMPFKDDWDFSRIIGPMPQLQENLQTLGANISTRAIGAILGFAYAPNDEELICERWELIKWKNGEYGLLFEGAEIDVPSYIKLEQFFNSQLDCVLCHLVKDAYYDYFNYVNYDDEYKDCPSLLVPTFIGILKGYKFY